MKMLLITLLLATTVWSGNTSDDLGMKGTLSELLGQDEAQVLEEDLLGRHMANDTNALEGRYEVRDAEDYGVKVRTENGVSWIQMEGFHGARLLKDGKLLAGTFNTSVYFTISDTTRIFYADRRQTDLDPVSGFDYICLTPVTAGGPMILLPNPFREKAGER